MAWLYKLEFSSGKIYVGVTKSTPQKRLALHRRDAALGRSTCAVHQAWRKYGEPTMTILGEFENGAIFEIEKQTIKELDSLAPNGYNLTRGGEASPMEHPEVRQKVSSSLKGHQINVGRRHTEASKRNMAAAQRAANKTISEEHKKQLSLAMKARHESGELKEAYKKISAANTGKKHTEETKLKMSAWQKGKAKRSVAKEASE